MELKNWALLDINYTTLIDGYTIIALTDSPCHLFMRWTLIEPQQHKKTVYRRGLALHEDKYFCFDVYTDNEQEEAGDTLTHTFVKKNWPVCQTRYFYFQGTKEGAASPSTSAIFKKHFKGVTMIGPYYLRITDTYWTKWIRHYVSGQNYIAAHDASNGTQVLSSSTRIIRQWKYALNKYYIERKGMYFDTSPIPDTAFILAAWLTCTMSRAIGQEDDVYLFNAPTLNDPPVLADYGKIRDLVTDEIGIFHKADYSSDTDSWFELNQKGLDAIVKDGWTKFAVRVKEDVDKVEPTPQTNYILSPDPGYLTVCYYLPE